MLRITEGDFGLELGLLRMLISTKQSPDECISCCIILYIWDLLVHFGCLHSIQFRALGLLLPKIWPIDALVLHGMSCRFKLESGGSFYGH